MPKPKLARVHRRKRKALPAVFGVGPDGCLPADMLRRGKRGMRGRFSARLLLALRADVGEHSSLKGKAACLQLAGYDSPGCIKPKLRLE